MSAPRLLVTSPVMRHVTSCAPWYHTLRRTHHHFCSILAKDTLFGFIYKEHQKKSTSKDIIQNNWSVFFKSVKIMKEKERLRNHPWLDQTKEPWQLKAMCEPGLNQGSEKGHSWNNGWKFNKLCRLYIFQCYLPGFDNCAMLMWDVNIWGWWVKSKWNSALFCNFFCISKIFWKWKLKNKKTLMFLYFLPILGLQR